MMMYVRSYINVYVCMVINLDFPLSLFLPWFNEYLWYSIAINETILFCICLSLSLCLCVCIYLLVLIACFCRFGESPIRRVSWIGYCNLHRTVSFRFSWSCSPTNEVTQALVSWWGDIWWDKKKEKKNK